MARRSVSIRLHLAIFGGLVLLPLVAAGLVITKLYVDKEHAQVEAQAQRIVSDATAAIDQELNRYKLALQVLASSRAAGEGNLEQFYLRAQALSESIPGSFIALRRADGETVFVTTEPFGEPSAAYTDAGLQAADQLAIKHKSAVITDLVSDAGRPDFVALEVPIVTYGKVDHLLLFGISPKGSVLDILTAQLGTSRWLLRVTDSNDRIVARSWDNDRFAGQKASETFARSTDERSGTFVATTAEGTPVFNVYQRSELSGWTIAAGLPVAELETPLNRSLQVLGIVSTIGVAISLLLAFLYARLLTRPLRQLYAVADARDEKTVRTGITELDGVTGTLMRAIVVVKDHGRARARTVNAQNQRLKNMIAIILAIAEHTRRRTSSLEQFGRNFEGRLKALARSHEALGGPDWHSGDLATLIAQTCKPFAEETQVALAGPPVELPPKAAIGIGMVIHELATNAAKYGALSTSSGKVRVSWDLPEEDGLTMLRLQWQEQGGPMIQAVHREGFGSVLLNSIVETDLGGRLDMIFSRAGLHCIACIPMNSLTGPSIVPQDDETEAASMQRR